MTQALRLRPLRDADEAEARAAHEELASEDFTFLLGWEGRSEWPAFIKLLADRRRGIGLGGSWVPATFLVAEVEGAIVGRASIRHELNAFLLSEGGHIGYAVRSAHRGRGYATEIMRQALIIARAEGVERVLVTCDDHNAASIAVIERVGGELHDVRPGEDGIRKRRYWIT